MPPPSSGISSQWRVVWRPRSILRETSPRLQAEAVECVEQRGLARAGLTGHGVDVSAQALAQGVYPLPRARTDGEHVRARAAILAGDAFGHLRVYVALVDGDDGLDALFARGEQQAVGHEQVRLRRGGGDDDEHGVDIGNRRAGELACARKDGLEPAVLPPSVPGSNSTLSPTMWL